MKQSQSQNVLVSLIEKVESTTPNIKYSPTQPGDLLVGEASATTLRLAALTVRTLCEMEIESTRLRFESDPVVRANLMDDLLELKLEHDLVRNLFMAQMRSEAVQTNCRLTLRDGGKIVFTEADRATSEEIIALTQDAADQAIEMLIGGQPPRGDRRMSIPNILKEIFGDNFEIVGLSEAA